MIGGSEKTAVDLRIGQKRSRVFERHNEKQHDAFKRHHLNREHISDETSSIISTTEDDQTQV